MAKVEAASPRLVQRLTREGARSRPKPYHGAPALLWVLAAGAVGLMLLPVAYLIVRSLGAGAEAVNALIRAQTVAVLLNSLGLAATVTAAAAAIAVPIAWLTTRTDLPGRKIWSVLAVLPLAIPTYVGGFALVAALGPKGMLQQLLAAPFGLERLPEIYGFPGAALALTLFSYPYLLLSVRAGLRGLDPALEEASRSLSQGGWGTFRRVIFPQLRPSLAAGSLLVCLYTLSDFGAVSLLQFNSFTRAIYVQYQGSFDRTGAALLGLLLVACTGLILLGEARTRGKRQYSRTAKGSRSAPAHRLGAWRWPALVFCSVVVVSALVLPAGVLVFWLVRGLIQGIEPALVWSATLNSAYAAALAAFVAVAVALPVSVLAVRFPGNLSGLLERAAYAGFALPGIVVALALVFFGANYAAPIYQTMALLVIAYVVRFLPQAIGAARSSLMQVSPRVEEAARSLGRTPIQVLLSITVPLVRPGILAGLGLVFLTTIKELPVTLLLSPIGFKTLATTTWARTVDGLFAEAAAPALLLLCISGLSMALILRSEGGMRGE